MSKYPEIEIFQSVPAELGEGPCWHAARQTLWWIDILGKKLFEVGANGGRLRVLPMPHMIGAVGVTRSGGLIATLRDGIYLVDPESGAAALFARAPDHDPVAFRFNDAKVDARGRLWGGTIALDERRGQSHLYRISGDGSVAKMRSGISVSNGIAWSLDGRTMYYIDSPTRIVQAFAFDVEQGTIGSPRVVITLGEADGYPDGCSMDEEGCLWVAHWGGAKVTRWLPEEGKLLRTVRFPVANVSSCAFGGARRDQLFVTTAVNKGSATVEPEAGFVFTLHPGTTGTEVATFAGG